MNQDIAWMFARSILLVGSGYLVGRGFLTDEQATQLVGAAGVLFTIGWQAWVRWNTKAVPAGVVTESQNNPHVPTIPTVSAATGARTDAPVN